MINTTLHANMIDRYNTLSYTHNYIFGFEFNGTIYASECTADDLAYITTLDKASRGAGIALRFTPNKQQKIYLMSKNSSPVCSVKMFNELVENSPYNRGEIFEKLLTEAAGQVWVKDNIPFTDDGDLTVNGIAYQIKFQKATFTNEKSLINLEGKN